MKDKAGKIYRLVMWIIAILATVGTIVVIQFLPESVPMHYDYQGNVDRMGSRWENLAVIGVVWIFAIVWEITIRVKMAALKKCTEDKKCEELKNNIFVFSIIGMVSTLFFTAMAAVYVIKPLFDANPSAGTSFDSTKYMNILFGIMFVVLGNYLPKTRRNSLVGFRTSWTMYNDVTWAICNRFAGKAFMAGGLALVIISIFVNETVGVFVLLGVLLVIVVVSMIKAYNVYQMVIKMENDKKAHEK